ncbi:MAG: hypothetical protein ABII23_01050 [bacterium]
MRKICTAACAVMMVAGLIGEGTVSAKSKRERKSKEDQALEIIKETGQFDVYTEKTSRKNHYIPSGYMGDYGDIKVNDRWTEEPRSGKTCIQIKYTVDMTQGAGWAGIYWQNPANNWGTRKGGYNLSGAKRVAFWARGEQGGEFISEFKVGGITGEYFDSDQVGITDIELTKNWKRYEIDLSESDLSYISGGFCWAANLDNNPDGITFYLDDIVYEFKDKNESKKKKKKESKK